MYPGYVVHVFMNEVGCSIFVLGLLLPVFRYPIASNVLSDRDDVADVCRDARDALGRQSW